MAKTTSGPAKKTGGSKPAKGRIITPPNASKELPKSFYQQDKAKGKKKSEVPDTTLQPSAAFRWRYFYTQKEVRQYAA